MLTITTKLRLTVNNTRDVVWKAGTTSLELVTVLEVLRSWLEMSFKMLTMLTSLSLGVACWRTKLIYTERTAPKRPDYLDFKCRESIEREGDAQR